MKKELAELEKYITLSSNEDAKRKHAYVYFSKLYGKEFKTESDASGADGYVAGKVVIELKSKSEDWFSGLYQALHYRKLGLTFPNIVVISYKFIGLWTWNNLPKRCLELADEADSQISPSQMGVINTNKTSQAEATKILKSNSYLIEKGDFSGLFIKDIDVELRSFTHALNHLDDARIMINLRNFIDHIERMEQFFEKPMDAIHAFYAIVGYWGDTSTVNRVGERNEVQVNDPSRHVNSEPIVIDEVYIEGFRKFVEQHYIFTNEGSGITYDNYFSRFDEAIAKVDPEYAKQHGIFFTNHNLSKFAMWFVHERFEKNLSDKYIVFDPAGGSGNLITSLDWRGNMKHKIVSELQPDLLKVIERRMRVHERHIGKYTIIPKTVDNKGLNFLDKSGADYLEKLDDVLEEKSLKIDKPLAFLMNPPYKNTDENVASREQVEAEYRIDDSILELTGTDAGRERYLAFLGQIVNIAKSQHEKHGFNPILMIFTPTSWLIPRPTYVSFREKFDKHFKYENGFIITSNEFFALKGKWPLAFTIWTYNENESGNDNRTRLLDLTYLKQKNLAEINWSARIGEIDKNIKYLVRPAKTINFGSGKKSIKDWTNQSMYDFKRGRSMNELKTDEIVGGLPITDSRRNNIKTYGIPNSVFLGVMDNGTPVRVKPKKRDRRFKDNCTENAVWFRFDTAFIDINKSRCVNATPDQKGYCAYNLNSATKTFTWFAVTKAISGKYPLWANQFNIWKPRIKKERESYFYSLCFAFGLSENRCVVTKFEKDNPVQGTPEVYMDNPLSTNNLDSFWNTVLDDQIVDEPSTALELVDAIKALYTAWARNHCMNGILTKIGLKEEPYFKYFAYDDFLTSDSGLIQIKKYADLHGKVDLIQHFEVIAAKTKAVKEEIYKLLVDDFKYFD